MSNMAAENDIPEQTGNQESAEDKNDLADMLQELRILLQGTQVLTAFLIILPFSEGFSKIDQAEKAVYFTTFVCALFSLILFSAPAVHHRLQRPLMDRVRFKVFATRMMIVGLVPLSVALTLASQLVVSEVMGKVWAMYAAIFMGLMIGSVWWLLPLFLKSQKKM